MGKIRKFGPDNRPTTTGEVKSFIKRASASAISEYLDFIHQAGYRIGVRDAVTAIRAESEAAESGQNEEVIDDNESVPSVQESSDDGEGSVD
jgi:hypothetical protein